MSTSIHLDRVFQPPRPELDRCLRLVQEHESMLAAVRAEQGNELTRCEQRIADISKQVLAQGTGQVPAELTTCERELGSSLKPVPPPRGQATLSRAG